MGKIDAALESCFEKLGRFIGKHPIKFLVGSVVFTFACCAGIARLKTETRPEKQWVAQGALALEHNTYVQETWPGNSRFNMFSATCADVDEDQCNILDPKYIKRMQEINNKIMAIRVDGDKIVEDLDTKHKKTGSWSQYAGEWSFSGNATRVANGVEFKGRKCFRFGPFCGKSSLMDVFRNDDQIINSLDTAGVQRALERWEEQETMCPLSLANENSPCQNSNCKSYKTPQERYDCRVLAKTYCTNACPTKTITDSQGNEVVRPVGTCMDSGCLQLGAMEIPPLNSGMLSTDGNGSAPESAFEFEPSKIKTMVGSVQGVGNIKYAKGKYLAGYFALNKSELYCPRMGKEDPVSEEWERQALCFMGIDADPKAEPKLVCEEDDLLRFQGLFARSLGDEFGNAIRGDVAKLGASYFVIIIYCAIMIGKRDAVHSGIVLSVMAVVIVGFTIGSTMGLMGLIQIPNSNLNNNLYFLILGLGVDDAFVLSSEFVRHTTMSPGLPISERIALTAKTGGISVLITSVTDALAFLVGSGTVLPALSWFCAWAGTAIILCYIFQLTVFLPVLALNARRAEANRRDCFCCCKAQPRAIDEPKGCCDLCLTPACLPDNTLRNNMKKFGEKITTMPGRIVTFVVFIAITAVGIAGSTMIYKDFKLEWFIPDDSYVNQYFVTNSEHFASGTKITINMQENMKTFDAQSNFYSVSQYLTDSKLVNQDVPMSNWHKQFMEWAVNPNQAVTSSMSFSPSRSAAGAVFTDSTEFYKALHSWYGETIGSRYRGSMLWSSAACNVESGTVSAPPAGCDLSAGLKAARFDAELTLAATDKGTDRYNTMTTLRKDLDARYPKAFPFSSEFLYWEEVGIIDTELTRNLIVCGVVIMVIVAVLVPDLRISPWVILCIGLSIVDVLGFMYFWDVTISGVSTIYILICVGLSVDYAAHIAHMFKDSTGTARERAIKSLERIGPCTFNAVLSTLLAVAVMGLSSSYVFRVLFKTLFLVVIIAGAHGLWLLPTILSLVGGDRDPIETDVTQVDKEKGEVPPPTIVAGEEALGA